MPFQSIRRNFHRRYVSFFLSDPLGVEMVWQGVFILRALIVIRKEDGDPVAATIELQGYREGGSFPEFFFFSERDWNQLGLLRSLLNVESSDPTNPWNGWFESNALDNGHSGAFHHYQDVVEEAAIETEYDRRGRLRAILPLAAAPLSGIDLRQARFLSTPLLSAEEVAAAIDPRGWDDSLQFPLIPVVSLLLLSCSLSQLC